MSGLASASDIQAADFRFTPELGGYRGEIDQVAALWTLITQHHAALDPLFRMRRGPVAEGELRELLRALQRDPDARILVYDLEDKLELW